ncbi:hypothetical protein SRHO_G00060920 [Serrasalmus rhombeus]
MGSRQDPQADDQRSCSNVMPNKPRRLVGHGVCWALITSNDLLLIVFNRDSDCVAKRERVAMESYMCIYLCRDLIADYCNNFRMRVSSGATTSSWDKVEIGIITGCTISVTLFSLAMNMLTKSAEPECIVRIISGQSQPPIRVFMDDLTGCRWILKGLKKLMTQEADELGPDAFQTCQIKIHGAEERKEKPVKILGKVFDRSIKDSTSIQSTCAELDGLLKSVDKSGLPGKFKAWGYQRGVLPRILWSLLIYAVPISTVETLERKVSNHLRRWLGLPKSLSCITLYGHNNKLQLPFKSLEEAGSGGQRKLSKRRCEQLWRRQDISRQWE